MRSLTTRLIPIVTQRFLSVSVQNEDLPPYLWLNIWKVDCPLFISFPLPLKL